MEQKQRVAIYRADGTKQNEYTYRTDGTLTGVGKYNEDGIGLQRETAYYSDGVTIKSITTYFSGGLIKKKTQTFWDTSPFGYCKVETYNNNEANDISSTIYYENDGTTTCDDPTEADCGC